MTGEEKVVGDVMLREWTASNGEVFQLWRSWLGSWVYGVTRKGTVSGFKSCRGIISGDEWVSWVDKRNKSVVARMERYLKWEEERAKELKEHEAHLERRALHAKAQHEIDLQDKGVVKSTFALYRWHDGYAIALAGQCGEEKFDFLHPEAEELETIISSSWKTASDYLAARRDEYWVHHDPKSDEEDNED